MQALREYSPVSLKLTDSWVRLWLVLSAMSPKIGLVNCYRQDWLVCIIIVYHVQSSLPIPPTLGTDKKAAVFGNCWWKQSIYNQDKPYLGLENGQRYCGEAVRGGIKTIYLIFTDLWRQSPLLGTSCN